MGSIKKVYGRPINQLSKVRDKDRKIWDYIDPKLSEDVKEFKRKAIKYRRENNYYEKKVDL
jgi:hypothetical protein